MGAPIDFTNHIDISDRSWTSGGLTFYGYNDLTDEFISEVAGNPVVRFVQITKSLPEQAFAAIDRILALREDMFFRLYSLDGNTRFDMSCLHRLKHLRHLVVDAHLRDNHDALDLKVLTELEGLRSLRLRLFDLRDYGFVRELSPNLEELLIYADTMGGAVTFDCDWLERYEKLERLFLGKKAKKHLESIADISSLRSLTLRGIKPNSFDFLRHTGLQSLSLGWCGMNDLSSLAGFGLKSLELWRINKLEDISFISTLLQLETLRLQDLKHIRTLPDMSALKHLRDITLDNVPVDTEALPEYLRGIVHR
ncbi:MAG: hypothetical protein E7559_00695 [Ruminococcaceae bacterium]|nr:hypothetical protein [Oscillospiraceae bacterium]